MWQVVVTLVWGLVVLGSFVALGRLLARVLDPTLLVDVPLTAGIGMAAMVFVGGVLNLAHIATTSVLIALIVALVALEALVGFRCRRRPATGGPAAIDPNGRVAAAAAIGVFLTVVSLRYVLSLGTKFMVEDDLPFYLPQIAKLLQTGTLGIEPYLNRQMQSLNGHTLLSALGCSVAPAEYAFLVDPGICWIMLGGLAYTFLRRDLELSIPVAGLLSTISLLVRNPNSNLGGQWSGPVLLLVGVRLMFTGITDSAALPVGRLVLAALLFSAIAALKSTFLVYAFLFVAFWSMLTMWRIGLVAAVRQALPLTVLLALFTMPWMIQQYLSSGTPLYPILGKGYFFANDGSQVHPHGDPLRFRLTYLFRYAGLGYTVAPLVTLIASAVVFARSASARSGALLAASLSAVLGSYLICFMLSQFSILRYTVPVLYISCLLPGLAGLAVPTRDHRLGLVFGCAFVLLLGNQWQDERLTFARTLWARAHGERFPELASRENIRHIQSLTEPGKRILAIADGAFLLDFRRNPIWNFDRPGYMSPPPGLPLTSDWKKLEAFLDGKSQDLPPPGPVADFRDFLVRTGVDYLFVDRNQWVRYYFINDIPAEPYVDRETRTIMTLAYDNIVRIAQDRHVVFDDGDIILMDLRQKRLSDDRPFVDSARARARLRQKNRRPEARDGS